MGLSNIPSDKTGPITIINESNIESLSDQQFLERILEFPSDYWISSINDGLVNKKGKEILASICANRQNFISLAARLSEQAGFGLTLAREICTDKNWQEFQALVDESKIKSAATQEIFVWNLGRLLTNKNLFFWVTKILFSRKIIESLLTLVRDGEHEIRLLALDALGTYDIELSKTSIINSLEDTNQKVRTKAIKILKDRLPHDQILKIAENSEDEANKLNFLMEKAKEAITSIQSSISGLSGIFKVFDLVQKADIVGTFQKSVDSITSSISSSLSDAWNMISRGSQNEENEDSDSLFALCLALVWADGSISNTEQEVMNSILEKEKIDEGLINFVDTRPSIPEIEKYIKKIKDPKRNLDILRQSLDLEIKSDECKTWLKEIESILGIEGYLTEGEVTL